MPEDSMYRNTIDYQLSKIAEDDQGFKEQLVAIYSEYMRDIPQDFTHLIQEKNWEGLVQLHHKHKTTCHVLALQELSDTFEQVRGAVINKVPDQEKLLDNYIARVSTICFTTLTQLQEIVSS
ncbi:MAG: hypothetical protein AAGE93_10275 [Bacteroidota bacterium]